MGARVGWQQASAYQFASSTWKRGYKGIGKVRVQFYTNDWSNPNGTLMGKNSNGAITPWKAPSSWLCSGSSVSDFRMGTYGKDDLFSALQSENQARTWVIRVIGFALLWLAFSLMFGPLGVVADCIPCIGPFLGDSIETITCCISCLPATACCSLVVGIVWTAMRPELGIPGLAIFVIVMIGFCIFKANVGKGKGLASSASEPSYGTAQ